MLLKRGTGLMRFSGGTPCDRQGVNLGALAVRPQHNVSSNAARLMTLGRGLMIGVVLCFLFVPTSLAVEEVRVYRCTNGSGVVEFSDRYCGGDATLTTVHLYPTSGMSLEVQGSFDAVEQANQDRAVRRGVARSNRLLSKLSTDYNSNRKALEKKREKLAKNALQKVNTRDITLKLEALKSSYLHDKDVLTRQLRNVKNQ
ncbi:MAG: DUF4124 domain-containing protein [Pseudomonadales bacterium]